MEITNAKQAREWLASWGFRPRRGIWESTVRGLRTSAAICRSYRCPEQAADYEAAAAVILVAAWDRIAGAL